MCSRKSQPLGNAVVAPFLVKSFLSTLTASLVLTLAVAAAEKPADWNAQQRASYAIGVNIAGNLKAQGLGLETAMLMAGIRDALTGKPVLSDAEMRAALEQFQSTMAAKQEAAGGENLKAGEAFLAANAKQEGVKTTASGLQYKELRSGNGPSPKESDTVRVHYHGTLIDGTVFDSSVDRGEPVSFGVGQVIPGWVEALQLMQVGDKWQLFIPSNLAYGERAAGGSIGPNSTLVFEVELLGID